MVLQVQVSVVEAAAQEADETCELERHGAKEGSAVAVVKLRFGGRSGCEGAARWQRRSTKSCSSVTGAGQGGGEVLKCSIFLGCGHGASRWTLRRGRGGRCGRPQEAKNGFPCDIHTLPCVQLIGGELHAGCVKVLALKDGKGFGGSGHGGRVWWGRVGEMWLEGDWKWGGRAWWGRVGWRVEGDRGRKLAVIEILCVDLPTLGFCLEGSGKLHGTMCGRDTMYRIMY